MTKKVVGVKPPDINNHKFDIKAKLQAFHVLVPEAMKVKGGVSILRKVHGRADRDAKNGLGDYPTLLRAGWDKEMERMKAKESPDAVR